jgi:hypothetical protein
MRRDAPALVTPASTHQFFFSLRASQKVETNGLIRYGEPVTLQPHLRSTASID